MSWRGPHPSSIDEPMSGAYYSRNRNSRSNADNRRNNENAIPKWFCPSCGEKQRMDFAKCSICETPRPAVILDAATVFQKRKERVADQWSCITCLGAGKDGINFGRAQRCKVCKMPRPTPEQIKKYEQDKQKKEEERLLAIQRREYEKARDKEKVTFVWEKPGWDKLRLIFLGQRDPTSFLSRLPFSIIQSIFLKVIYVPPSTGDLVVSYFKNVPNGRLRVITNEFIHDYYPDSDSGWTVTFCPSTPQTPFVYSYHSWHEGARQDSLNEQARLTKGQFLYWWQSVDISLTPMDKNRIYEACVMDNHSVIEWHSRPSSVKPPDFRES
eukprot:Phypoly_transcript_07775.p1 GENE.Phypoly_transcript_07775~~Phypoly_transcript_07775.p1  ORF type:complete len:326 (+),score=40.16 Phypoly_transcript_07775:516-1493(+)